MKRSVYARYAWPIMAVLAALIPVIALGVKRTFEGANNNVRQWLPQDFPETRIYEQFRREFGEDAFAVVSWEGCTLDDRRLERFAGKVVPPPGHRRPGDGSEYFAAVVTGSRALARLMDEPFRLPREKAIDRLRGTLVGRDRKTTCALVTLSETGDVEQAAALTALREIATGHCGVPPDDLRLGGDPVANAAIDIESERAVRQWIVLSWVITLAVAWRCLRRIRLMVMIFVVAVYSSLLTTALIYYTGGTMNLVLVVVPVLIYVLPLSAAVHLSNYYRDAIRESGPAGAPLRAVAAGWTPCALSATTTALGLISLCVSHILPVRTFGAYASAGILLSLIMLFVLLPAMMETWPAYPAGTGREDAAGRRDRLLRLLARWIIRRRRTVVAVCVTLLVFFSAGIAFVETTVAPVRFFSPQSRWIRDGLWLQDRLGPVVPFEVVLAFDGNCPLTFLERMELVRRVERTIRGIDQVGGTISAATFGPDFDLPQAAGADTRLGPAGRAALRILGIRDRSALRQRMINRRLVQHRDRFLATDYLSTAGGRELWRISARVEGTEDMDYDRFIRRAKDRVDEFLQTRLSSPETVQASYTGVVPMLFLAQRELLASLLRSFCLAFAMIAVLMVVLLRSISAGLLVMLPNVFPAVATFGMMGWTSALVDVGAMMTASVALGIAVDDTLHFLTWFNRAVQRGQTRNEAIITAYLRCAPAMIQTTLIAGLGLLVFCLSSFQPVSQFGLLMFILLAAALVGDLILLPAMLATRLGKRFQRYPK